MRKQFIISDRQWPSLHKHDVLLQINKIDVGYIKIEDLGSGYFLCLQMYDTSWKYAPIIAADLYQHAAGAIGYNNLQSATQAAAAILTAHGWDDTTELSPATAGEAGQSCAEYALLILFVVAAVIVIGAVIRVDVVHIINTFLRWLFPWGWF